MGTMYYTDDHEWLNVEGNIATVGVSQHAADQMGDVVFVELPDVERQVTKGDDVVVVESVKAASDVYAPISGEITEVNDSLTNEPSTVNASPEADGWLFKMTVADSSELEGLMDAKAYAEMTG